MKIIGFDVIVFDILKVQLDARWFVENCSIVDAKCYQCVGVNVM
jgi:hypothetical protein